MKPPRIGSVVFVACMVVVTAGAAGLRFAGLGQRPMHPDEANQAVKAGILLETGRYEYSPDEHHGPSLYWLTVPVLRLLGAHDLAHTSEGEYRLVPALFGVALVALVFLVSDGLGRGPTVLAAAFTALSPAMVFYGRYYIQETLLVFFTFAAIACGWRYLRSRSAGWAIAAGGFVGLMHATKETWVLAAAAMVVAVAACTGSTWLAAREGRIEAGSLPTLWVIFVAGRFTPASRRPAWQPSSCMLAPERSGGAGHSIPFSPTGPIFVAAAKAGSTRIPGTTTCNYSFTTALGEDFSGPRVRSWAWPPSA